MKPMTMSDYFGPSDSIFSFMQFDFEYLSKEQLDIMFYANYGDKNPAPIVTKILSLPPTVDELVKISLLVESMYGVKWSKLKSLTKLEYDPINNYKDKLTELIKEVGENNTTHDSTSENNLAGTTNKDNLRTDDLSNVVGKETTSTGNTSKDKTRTDNLSNVVGKDSTSTTVSNTDDSIYGFNSTEASNSDNSKTTETLTENLGSTITSTGTQKNDELTTETLNENLDSTTTSTGTQKNVESTIENSTDSKTLESIRTSNSNNDRTRESTHEGNIGNLSTQQLLKQEIELWKWNYIQTVLTDVNEFLTIPIYLS